MTTLKQLGKIIIILELVSCLKAKNKYSMKALIKLLKFKMKTLIKFINTKVRPKANYKIAKILNQNQVKKQLGF